MKTIHLIVGMFPLALTAAALADTIRLSDGTTLEGELGAPVEIIINTAAGEKRVPFALLPPEVQKLYRGPSAEKPAAVAPAEQPAPVAAVVGTEEEFAALANEVNLDTWEQVTAIGSFRDRAEKRGTGGLVVTKAFNAIEENWGSVYSPKDVVGQAGNWDAQISRAKALQERAPQFLQKRWLALFIKAGEAIARRDSNEFAQLVRELKRSPLSVATAAR